MAVPRKPIARRGSSPADTPEASPQFLWIDADHAINKADIAAVRFAPDTVYFDRADGETLASIDYEGEEARVRRRIGRALGTIVPALPGYAVIWVDDRPRDDGTLAYQTLAVLAWNIRADLDAPEPIVATEDDVALRSGLIMPDGKVDGFNAVHATLADFLAAVPRREEEGADE